MKRIYMSMTDPPPNQLPQLYGVNLQRATKFTYLVSAMNIMASIGVRARCLGKLLSTRLYRQFIRPKMEYGMAIAKLNRDDYNILQETQNTCLRKIYGTKTNHSMAIIHHLANLEFIVDRVTTLQAKFMPDDALFPTLLPQARQTKGLRSWTSVIRKNKIWQSLDTTTQLDHHMVTNSGLKTAIKQHIKSTHIQRCQRKNSKLLNQCRQQLGIDPILWLPMTSIEHNLCIHYRLGWITNHQQQPCPNCHQTTHLSKQHLLSCHRVHTFLSIPKNISDPISFILNRLPKTPPTSYQKRVYWKIIWPKLSYILHQLHRTYRPEYYTTPSPPTNQFGHLLLQWIEPPLVPHASPSNLNL
ncbi:hypothetical protein INT45_006046 [Circinella minor]|uniref:Uncharacterized protein n=1 Tax=Circinella minor TaxID=1195481 RepID=A0A8H7VM61_9FUNG|nr:hypothetical protein INT45_006046 [Circinella minor]